MIQNIFCAHCTQFYLQPPCSKISSYATDVIRITEALYELFLTMLNFISDAAIQWKKQFKLRKGMSEPTACNVQLCTCIVCVLYLQRSVCLLVALFSFFLLASHFSARTSSAHTLVDY